MFSKTKEVALEISHGWFVYFTSSVASFFVASESSLHDRRLHNFNCWNILMSVLILIQMGT